MQRNFHNANFGRSRHCTDTTNIPHTIQPTAQQLFPVIKVLTLELVLASLFKLRP